MFTAGILKKALEALYLFPFSMPYLAELGHSCGSGDVVFQVILGLGLVRFTEQMLDLRQLRFFVTVAECGSVSLAASRLNIAQPALSRHIRQLEREVGTELMVRHRRGVTLTGAGLILADQARELLGHERHALDAVRSGIGSVAGPLALGMPAALGTVLLPRALRELLARHPRVEPYVVEGLSGQLTEALRAGRVDVAVMNNASATDEIDVLPFIVSQMFLVTPRHPDPAWPAVAGPATLGEAARLPMLLASPSHTLRKTIEAAFAARRLPVRPVIEVDSLTLLKSLVSTGLGCTLLNYYAVASEVERGLLRAIPLRGAGIPWRLDIAVSRRRAHAPVVRAFIELLRAEAERTVAEGELQGSLKLYPTRPKGG